LSGQSSGRTLEWLLRKFNDEDGWLVRGGMVFGEDLWYVHVQGAAAGAKEW
jgi:hypothetical protein